MNYTKETFAEELKRRFPLNNIEILEFTGTNKPIKYKCLSCGRIINKSRANHLYENKTLCQHCYSSRPSKIRDWILNFFNSNNNFTLLSWNENVADSLEMQCNTCLRIFNKKPGNLYQKQINTICPYCGDNGAPMPQEDFECLMQQKGYKNYQILNYQCVTKTVQFQHHCGYIFSQKGENFLKSKGCPKCYGSRSKGELKIEEFLLTNNINFVPEFHPKDLLRLSYDFYLPDFQTFIEYQGHQHYYAIDYFGGENKFKTQQQHDKDKYEYAIKNHYQLIIIPYYDYNNITSYLLPLLGSTTNLNDVASSEAKEKTLVHKDNIV